MHCAVQNMVVNHLKFADDVCVFSPSISGLQCLLNICGDYAAEHEIIFLNCNKTIGVLFCPKKYKQPAPSNVCLNGVRVQFLNQVKYLGVWINALLKDDDDIQRQVKSLYCAANKLRGTFDQCNPAVKHTLFRAYCMPMYACQLWSKHTQTSMKRLRAAYNKACAVAAATVECPPLFNCLTSDWRPVCVTSRRYSAVDTAYIESDVKKLFAEGSCVKKTCAFQ